MSHTHHEHTHKIESLSASYFISIGLNFAFVVIEAIVGLSFNSIGLLSDAGHKLLDVLTLVIAMIGFKLASSTSAGNFNHRKVSGGIALFNAVVLLVAVGVIIFESISKLLSPGTVSGEAISITAGIGIIVSGVSAILLMQHQKRDINTRGAFLHMATDALVGIGVVVSGVVISLTRWYAIDPIISLIISVIILYNTIQLLIGSIKMILEK